MVAAAFTLTNCTQEIDAPVEPSVDGVPFEIVAKSADTKTANDGLKTVWAEGVLLIFSMSMQVQKSMSRMASSHMRAVMSSKEHWQKNLKRQTITGMQSILMIVM